jgi:hypothetical protein
MHEKLRHKKIEVSYLQGWTRWAAICLPPSRSFLFSLKKKTFFLLSVILSRIFVISIYRSVNLSSITGAIIEKNHNKENSADKMMTTADMINLSKNLLTGTSQADVSNISCACVCFE